jgi:hypothetical protein
MASNFVFPQATYTSPSNSQYVLYGSQQTSPVSSVTATPSNISPTSPRSGPPSAVPTHLPRQLRPPKSPLYVPAALRPTERPLRSTPPTPPQSMSGSLESLKSDVGVQGITRTVTSSSGLSQILEFDWANDDDAATVTALPTRDHWKVS